MNAYKKYRTRVVATKGTKEIEVFSDLFTTAQPDWVRGVITSQVKRALKFPVTIEVTELPDDEFLYQACSSAYAVVNDVTADFANIFYNYGK